MKKVYAVFILLLLFSVIGCSKKTSDVAQAQAVFSPPIDKLSWGMTSDQCKTALTLDKNPDEATYETDDTGALSIITLAKTQDHFGFPATVILKFDPVNDAFWYPYHTDSLSSVQLIYADVKPDQLKEKLVKKFGNSGEDWTQVATNESCTTWESPYTITNLSASEQSKWSDFDALYQKYQDTSLERATAAPLNQVILSINKDETATSVEFYGGVVSIINNLK